MKKVFLFIFFCCTVKFDVCVAQAGQWTWMKGYSTTNSLGNYGTQGVPDPQNEPPAVYGPVRWTDLDGNFWLFGGAGFVSGNSDLWKFNLTTNEWTWMKGPGTSDQPGNYGIMGIPSSNNNPGARAYGAASWTDVYGDLWMFGGNGYGTSGVYTQMLADLWRYHIATNEWTWMKGDPSDPAHRGTMQVADPLNTPGMHEECAANWVDFDNRLWFYSGLSDLNFFPFMAEMWRFDVSTNEWAWMSGDTVIPGLPVFGTQHVFDPTNTPGARMNYCGWRDPAYHFWLFGGQVSTQDNYADLWEYDPAINQWAWISGSNVPNSNGTGQHYVIHLPVFFQKHDLKTVHHG